MLAEQIARHMKDDSSLIRRTRRVNFMSLTRDMRLKRIFSIFNNRNNKKNGKGIMMIFGLKNKVDISHTHGT